MGRNAAGLTALLGKPDADFREGAARKLQFQGPICVLDAYLYPEKGAEPRVTYVDARQRDGTPIDRASCVAALTRRNDGRSEEHTSELQSLMRISYAVFCFNKT